MEISYANIKTKTQALKGDGRKAEYMVGAKNHPVQ